MAEPLSLPVRTRQVNQFAPMLVALFLVLLTFFILLNSIASRNAKRSSVVVSSVQAAFGKETAPPPSLEVTVAESDVSPDFVGEMKQAVTQLVQLKDVNVTADGDELQMEMPSYILFLDGDSDRIDPAAADFLNRVAETLNQWLKTQTIELDLLVGYAPKVSDGIAELPAKPIKQADALVRELTQRFIPADAISAGLKQGPADRITFAFTVRKKPAANAP